MAPQRYRLCFAKQGVMRHIGHLDLQRTFERTLRRARVPLAYTAGHHPRPRLTFASALPLGCIGEAELVEIWIAEPWTADELHQRLDPATPPGLRIVNVEPIEAHAPSLASRLAAAEYRVAVERGPADLDQRVAALLAAGSLMRERRGRRYDLRPLVLQLELVEEDGGPTLAFTLDAREGRTGRPHEVLDQLGLDPQQLVIRRCRLRLSD
jgi:radical SAM-linked protein